MSDDKSVRNSLLGYLNDESAVEPYRSGFLTRLPLHYSDGDTVELYVERFSESYRVSDRGLTELRLEMAGVNLENQRVREALERSLPQGTFDMGDREGEISAIASSDDLGRALFQIAEASLRVDQLRYLAPPPRRRPFAEHVVSSLRLIVDKNVNVQKDYEFRTAGGTLKRATAAVRSGTRPPLLMQAVSGHGNTLEDSSVEHCYYLFSNADEKAAGGKVAVLPGSRETVESTLVHDLERVGTVAFVEDESLRDAVQDYLHAVA